MSYLTLKEQRGISMVLVLLGIVLVLGIGSFVAWWQYSEEADESQQSINSFESCAAAGNPVAESYPRQCTTSDGRHFVEEIDDPIELPEN